MREITVESALVRGVEEAGGLVRKLVWPGRRHAPDRLVILPHEMWRGAPARVIFVELKAPRKKPRKGQEREHKRLRDLGAEVWVIDTLDGVYEFLKMVA